MGMPRVGRGGLGRSGAERNGAGRGGRGRGPAGSGVQTPGLGVDGEVGAVHLQAPPSTHTGSLGRATHWNLSVTCWCHRPSRRGATLPGGRPGSIKQDTRGAGASCTPPHLRHQVYGSGVIVQQASGITMRARWAWLVLLLLVLLVSVAEGKRGKGRGKKGRRTFNRGSITKFKSEDSRAYYNHNGGAKITLWSHFESEYVLGRKIVFMCTAQGEPRPVITWFKDGIELYSHSFFQVHEWKEGKALIKSKMEIDPATQMDAGYYECQADNKYAVDVKGFSADYSIEFA
ncbi:uncharacterized protein [Panulirus ornatus]|uniref:uncharacterized protein isoform X2 n=1 Tax=Panulirus ornatus TaxID=150431 RepID=UPI003A891082